MHRCLEKDGAHGVHVAGQACVVFAAGAWAADEVIQALVDKADMIVACDGALTECVRRGIKPQTVIGDMDSVDHDLLDRFAAEGGLVQHDANQDTNDLAKTLAWVEQQGVSSCSIVGVTGGDAQHEWANLMTCASSTLDIRCEGLHHVYRFFRAAVSNSIGLRPGASFSIFAIPEAHEIHLSGAKFELTGSSLFLGSEGLHNVATSAKVKLSFKRGRLMIMHPRFGSEGEGRSGA